MKTFGMIGMALAAILVCVNLTSCDKDDDDHSGDATNTTNNGENGSNSNGEKRLAKVILYDVEDGTNKLNYSHEFFYGANGYIDRINSEIVDFGKLYSDVCVLTWNSTKSFTVDCETFFFDNGRASKSSDESEYYSVYYYVYNDNGQLKGYGEELENGERHTNLSLNWSDGKLLSMIETDFFSVNTTSFDYSDKICKKGFFPLLSDYLGGFCEVAVFTAHPELVGLKTKHLPKKMTDGNKISTFEYKFDSEGYVIGCTERETYKDGGIYTYYYEFFWE